ncbi:MAG: DUF1801 domain-containing protein [Bacteroidota bacterium]
MSSVESYIENLAEDRKSAINSIRDRLMHHLPEGSRINMDYRMPTFIVDEHILFALASQKHHMALYVMPFDLLDDLKEELTHFDMGKSCIRFRKLTDERLEALNRIIQYVVANQDQSENYRRYPAKS